MSRIPTGDPVVVKPSNNVYTALLLAGTLVNLLGFVVILMRFATVFGDKASLFRK